MGKSQPPNDLVLQLVPLDFVAFETTMVVCRRQIASDCASRHMTAVLSSTAPCPHRIPAPKSTPYPGH